MNEKKNAIDVIAEMRATVEEVRDLIYQDPYMASETLDDVLHNLSVLEKLFKLKETKDE